MAVTKFTQNVSVHQGLSQKPNSSDGLTYQQLQSKWDEPANNIKTYINDTLTTEVDTLDSANVKLTGNQSIAGVKTFNSSPVVPTPTTDYQSSTKKYVDDTLSADASIVRTTGNQSVAGVKTFSNFPVTPSSNPTSNYEVTNKKYVDDIATNFTLGVVADNSLTTTKMATEQKRGVANGVASLGSDTKVPLEQIPVIRTSFQIFMSGWRF